MKSRDNLENSGLEYYELAKIRGRQTGAPKPAAPAKEFKYIGKATPRVDGKMIVTGAAHFTHDLFFEDMLYGKVLRCPHACADVISIDLSPAMNYPGVKAAVKLKEGRVRWAGEQVAAVAAVDEQTVEEALKLIKVEYKVLPHVVGVEKAMEKGAPQVMDSGNIQELNKNSRGDVEKGFQEADLVFEQTYVTSWEVHQTAETHASVAKWEGENLTVWDSTQAVMSVRDGLARALNIPASRVKVIKTYMGGGFGSKLGTQDFTVAAARLARETNRPVKIVLTRRENSYCVGYRPSSKITIKGGVKKDGTLTALSMKNYNSGGIGRGDSCSEPLVDIYKCPNIKVEEYSVFVNTCGSRPTRAPGHVQGAFALEGFLEELAAKLSMDPLELRMKNYSVKNAGDTGIPYSTKGLDKCYKQGAEKIGWTTRNKKPGGGAGKIKRGIGMASQIWWGSGTPGTLADLKIYRDGSVEVECGTQDIGCGTRTHIAVVAADTLTLEPQDITVKIGNSDYPWAPSSGGSQTTPSVAPAVRDAALKAVESLKQMASKKLGAPPAEITLENRRFILKSDPTKGLDFKEAVKDLRRPAVFHGERSDFPSAFAFNSFGVHFAEVEVDTETGKIRVKKVVAAHDIGRVINRLTAESQVIGGITQGLSAALFEDKVMDHETGTMINPNFHDYKIATAMDIPEMVAIFVDVVDDRLSNLGAKGLGEPGRIPASAAIANAVFNAIGVHPREIPMTPAKVLQALKRKEVRS
jgi:xanthine dehydrogenase YagR molybdenum-binding subunit